MKTNFPLQNKLAPYNSSIRKLFTILFIFAFNLTTFAQQGEIYTEVNADSVTIWHVKTERNCASIFGMEIEFDDYHLDLIEVDSFGLANCLCYFDLFAGIGNLSAGDYTVDIWGTGLFYNLDTVFWGSTTFTIIEGGQGQPQINSEYQSECNPSSPCPPPENLQLEIECNEFSITNSGENISTILGFNLYINGSLVGFIEDFTYYLGSLGNGSNQICITTVCDDGESEAICWDVEIPYGDPATGFQVELSANGALLSWNAPDGIAKSLNGFHIFRDFELLTTSIVNDTFYLDESITFNTLYQYFVTAVYDNCESMPTDTLQFIMTGIDKPEQLSLLIFPNPATTQLNIHSAFPVLSFRMFDLIGEEYFHKKVLKKDFQLDISQIPGGIYFIQIETDQGLQTKRIVVQ